MIEAFHEQTALGVGQASVSRSLAAVSVTEAGVVGGAQTVGSAGCIVFAIALHALADRITTLADIAFATISVRDAAIVAPAGPWSGDLPRVWLERAVAVGGRGAVRIMAALADGAGIVGIGASRVARELRNTADSTGSVLEPVVATDKASI